MQRHVPGEEDPGVLADLGDIAVDHRLAAWLGVDGGGYWSAMQANVDFYDDVVNGIIKSVVFALIVIWIALHKGYDAVPTSEGISRATTQTVVTASLAVLGFDFILTALMFGG